MRASTGHVGRRAAVLLLPLVPAILSVGCGARGTTGSAARRSAQPARAQTATLATLAALDPAETYRRAGFLTTSGPVSFVGNVRVLAGPTVDSVLAIVAISLPSRSLTFTREGERYRAAYEVEFELLKRAAASARPVGHFEARET